jgi:hypothetical protein
VANLYPQYPVGHIVVNWAPITIEPYSTSCEYSRCREGRGFVCAFIPLGVMREKDAGRRELISEPNSLGRRYVEVKFEGEGVPSWEPVIRVWKA